MQFQERKSKCLKYKYLQFETIYQREEAEQPLVVAEKYILGKKGKFFEEQSIFKKTLICKHKFLYYMQCPKLMTTFRKNYK